MKLGKAFIVKKKNIEIYTYWYLRVAIFWVPATAMPLSF